MVGFKGVVKRVWMVVLLLFTLISGCVSRTAESTAFETVPAQEFKSELEKMTEGSYMILDVRTLGEFTDGHIAGAVNIDFYDDAFIEQIDALDREKTYFIYCRSGNRSGQALRTMESMEFTRVYNLQGGITSAAAYFDLVNE